MSQLQKLKKLVGNPSNEDEILEFYLDRASDIICDLRNSNRVEDKYLNTQIAIALEFYYKRGAEGQISHGENGINRAYQSADVSKDILRKITPVVKTPFSEVRVIE